MSLAKKCDICGGLYEAYNVKCSSENVNGYILLNIDTNMKYFSHNMVDCCPACMDSIKAHIKELSERSKIQEG